MKKTFISMLALLAMFTNAIAQDYKVNKTTGRLVIKLPSVTVETHDGNEVVFSILGQQDEFAEERSAGLRLLSGTGLSDNTNLGINVTDKGTNLEVNRVSSKLGRVKILVPKNLSISYDWQDPRTEDTVVFKNIKTEIDISVKSSHVLLVNITGPLTVSSISNDIVAQFIAPLTGPITIASLYGKVDVSLPVDTKANLKLLTHYGDIFAASEMKIELKKRTDKDFFNEGNIEGTLNGGGTEISLKSSSGKIYLRKAK